MHNVKREQSKVTAKKVIEMISAQYGVSVTDMKSKKRQKKIVETRQIAMYLLKNNDELDLSLTAIGGLFGGKDHSTVISSIRKIDKKTKEDVAFKKEIEALFENLSEAGVNAEEYVIYKLKESLDRYVECFNLKGYTSRLKK